MDFSIYKGLVDVECCLNGKDYNLKYDNKISFPDKYKYTLGFDQSNTQTGIAICIRDNLVGLIDFINKGVPDATVYRMMLLEFLKNTTENLNIEEVIIEKPWGGKKFSYGRLKELEGCMKLMKSIIPSWNNVDIKSIYPQSWRSEFLTSQDYKGRFVRDKVKYAVREEFCIRQPKYINYAHKRKRVPDSLEAYGLVVGYRKKNYTDDGGIKVNTTMEKKLYSVKHQLLKCNIPYIKENIGEEGAYMTMLREYGELGIYGKAKSRGLVKMEYNNELSEIENMQRACSVTSKVVVLPIPVTDLYSSYMWDIGKPLTRGDIFVLAGYRVNK